MKFSKEDFILMLDNAMNQPVTQMGNTNPGTPQTQANPMLQKLVERARTKRQGENNGISAPKV
jgi:hypothetical protein